MNFSLERSFAEQQDRADPLAKLRDEFRIPTRADGSRAGLPLRPLAGPAAEGRRPAFVQEELDSWAQRAVDGSLRIAAPVAELSRALRAFARAPGRRAAAGSRRDEYADGEPAPDARDFLSSDARALEDSDREACLLVGPLCRRIADAAARIRSGDGRCSKSGPRPGEEAVRTEDVLALIEREGAQIATVMLPGVQFLNGQRFDLRAIAQQAHARRLSRRLRPGSRDRQRAARAARLRRRFRRLVPLQIPERRSGRDRRLLRP